VPRGSGPPGGRRAAEWILSVDLGAGSLRSGAVSADGRLAATCAVPVAIDEPRPGWSEVDPRVWWTALGRAVATTLDRLAPGGRVRAVCLAGLTRSQVLLDARGRVLGPAICFQDRRAAADAAALASHFVVDNPADAITAFHPLARLAWVARRQPALFHRIGTMLEPKDYLNARLTGVAAADAVTYSRFDALGPPRASAPPWVSRCVELLDLPRALPWTALGTVTAREPPFDRLRGLPVFAGAMDAWAAAVGAGAIRPGQAYDVAGTSEVVGLITGAPARVPGLVSLRWGEAVHQVGGPTQAGADCARWAHRTFRVPGPLARAVERAGALPPAEERPLFLPYLAGERAPVWRADVRGAFHGLLRGHTADELLWAVLEGVAHAARDILATAVAGTGQRASEVRIAGGGARSDAWCQLKADLLGLRVARAGGRETGLLGAGMAAAVGLGWHRTLDAAVRAMSAVDRVFEPRAAHAAMLERRAGLYARAKQDALARADEAAERPPRPGGTPPAPGGGPPRPGGATDLAGPPGAAPVPGGRARRRGVASRATG
jgi:xylulokinase